MVTEEITINALFAAHKQLTPPRKSRPWRVIREPTKPISADRISGIQINRLT